MTVVALTGASGRLGRLVIESLSELTRPGDVVLATRDPDGLRAAVPPGMQLRFADFDAPESLPAAFAGVDRLLVISTDHLGERVRQHRAAFAAAAAVGVDQVIYTSMLKPTAAHPCAPLASDHRLTEEALRAAGPIWSILRYGFFAETLLGSAERAVQSGRWISNAGGGHASWVAVADCAEVAAHVLAFGGHERQILEIVGPEALSYADIVRLLADISGQPIELVSLDDRAYREDLIRRGAAEADADEYTSFGPAIRRGFATAETGTVLEITGRSPRGLREVLLGHGLAPGAARSASAGPIAAT
ncbi:MAG TPA: NAD(P)H-binding protein [Solirubrobacteraceae bacterium]|nr:NAD(P)H-binding protein [Solirubrobacteraceae bacterium]